MPLPPFNDFLLPTLRAFADGNPAKVQTKRSFVANALGLTEEQREQTRPSGRLPQYVERINVACTYLRKFGALESEGWGVYRITPLGMSLLERYLQSLTIGQLRAEYENRNGEPAAAAQDAVPGEPDQAAEENQKTPLEIIDSEFMRWRELLVTQLLDVVRTVSPRFFENLVLDVLVAMGYGGSVEGAARAVGGVGDGGIDGIIKEDRLGLDVIYVQARRWQQNVGRPEVQAFVGALAGKKAHKGVFITTSDFTKDAREYVQDIDAKIVLIDGRQLAELMIDHDVGVTVVQTYKLKRVDSDYFEAE